MSNDCNLVTNEEDCGLLERIRMRLHITEGFELARRYLAMNAFDGVLPILGILMGGIIAMFYQSSQFVYQTSLLAIIGTTFAMFISGITSSYLTESAEQKRDIKELEQSLLSNLENSIIIEASRTTIIVVSLVNGLSPALSSIITIIPLFLPLIGLISIELAFVLSILLGLVVIFTIGVYLGKVSKTNVIVYGLKTLAAGILVIFMMWFFSQITGA